MIYIQCARSRTPFAHADIIKHVIKSVQTAMQLNRLTMAILLLTVQNPLKTSASRKDVIRE
jgi:hypothetical protein